MLLVIKTRVRIKLLKIKKAEAGAIIEAGVEALHKVIIIVQCQHLLIQIKVKTYDS